jgi:hypothetical protein
MKHELFQFYAILNSNLHVIESPNISDSKNFTRKIIGFLELKWVIYS